MATQKELDNCYMTVAVAHAYLSKSERKKVGACLVTKHSVLLCGVNGRAPKGSNECEYTDENGNLITYKETIHAELSAILKAAREGVSVVDSTLYTTLSCCTVCAEMIAAAGIKRVVYLEKYRDESGIKALEEAGIIVEQLKED